MQAAAIAESHSFEVACRELACREFERRDHETI
jgi:hypothetical protein